MCIFFININNSLKILSKTKTKTNPLKKNAINIETRGYTHHSYYKMKLLYVEPKQCDLLCFYEL